MPPKASSMYPSSISRALCSDGMRCIKPLAPSRNETNSSRVNGGAVGAILGICSYGGPDQAEFVATIKLVQPRPEGFGISANQQTASNLPGTACRSFCPNASPCREHPTNDQLGRHSTCKCSNP